MRKQFFVLPLAMLAVTLFCGYQMVNEGKEDECYSVSVIVNNSNSDRWNAFKEGLNQSASERQIYLNVVSTGEFGSLEEEYAIIRREIESGADGVIVEACDSSDEGNLLYTLMQNSNVMLVETALEQTEASAVVMPDNYALGRAVAQALVADAESKKEIKTVGLLLGNQKQLSQKERLQGFEEALDGSGIEIAWQLSREEWSDAAYLQETQSEACADALAALDNDATEAAVDYCLSHEQMSGSIYAQGRSEKTVYYLDKGVIHTLIVPNEYYMGYQSLNLLEKRIGYHLSGAKGAEVDFVTVTAENLYDDEIGKILFPVVR